MYLLSQSHSEPENETKDYNTEDPPPCVLGPGVYRSPPHGSFPGLLTVITEYAAELQGRMQGKNIEPSLG